MRYLLVAILLFGCVGCVTTDPGYYTRSDSPGYYESHWGGLCSACNRGFIFSTYQLNTTPDIQCPYCGVELNLRQAHNRYVYEEAQRRKAEWAETQKAIKENAEKIAQERHTDIRDTMKYSHLAPENMREDLKVLERMDLHAVSTSILQENFLPS